MALVRYTFDRVGRVFDTSSRTAVSIIPVIVAVAPIGITLIALLALQVYACRACTKTTSPDRRTNAATAVEDGQQDFHFDNPIRPRLHRAASSTEQAENRRQQFAEQQQRQQQQRDERGPFGFTKGLFRVNTGAHQADAVVEMQDRHAAAASDSNSLCSCLRLPRLRLRLRLIWSGMKESHELLAIFMAQRQPGMGASERLALFLGCLESQLLGATLMYHLNACYKLTSIFEEDAMPLGDWMSARALMMLQTSLFTVPIDIIVDVAFEQRRKQMMDQTPRPEGGRTRTRASRACRAMVRVLPWVLVTAQAAISSSMIVMMTAARQSSVDDGTNALPPCHCRISHNAQQSHQWLVVILLQIGFWLLVSRPGFIAFVLAVIHCNKKRQRWTHARMAKRRSSIVQNRMQNSTEMVTRNRVNSMTMSPVSQRHASNDGMTDPTIDVMVDPAIDTSSSASTAVAISLVRVSSRRASTEIDDRGEHFDNPFHSTIVRRRSQSQSGRRASTSSNDPTENVNSTEGEEKTAMNAQVPARVLHLAEAPANKPASGVTNSAGGIGEAMSGIDAHMNGLTRHSIGRKGRGRKKGRRVSVKKMIGWTPSPAVKHGVNDSAEREVVRGNRTNSVEL